MQARDPHTLVYSTEHGPADGRRPEHGTTQAPDRSARGSRNGDGAPADGIVRVWLERQGRNGKPVSIVRGLRLEASALVELAARLKRPCGSGGQEKDCEIILQGDHRARIAAELGKDGLRVKLAGG
jgi:translation initiation factor 1